MNARHDIITLSFLQKLEKEIENEHFHRPIHPAFETLLSKKELVSILNHMYDGEAETEYPHLNKMSKKSLLELINDEYYILNWLIEKVLGSYVL